MSAVQIMRPSDYLEVAKFILDNVLSLKPDEAWIRTGVSRAYYAVFLYLRERLNVKVRGSEAHKAVYLKLKRVNRGLARELKMLRILRNDADYDLERPFSPDDLRRALITAKKIVDRIR